MSPLVPPVSRSDHEERRRRLAEIRELVARGEYRVPAERVADAVLRAARLSRGSR